jgi:hypothetical protein
MKSETNPFKTYENRVIEDYQSQLKAVKRNVEDTKNTISTVVNVVDVYTDNVFSVISKVLGSK